MTLVIKTVAEFGIAYIVIRHYFNSVIHGKIRILSKCAIYLFGWLDIIKTDNTIKYIVKLRHAEFEWWKTDQ